MKFCQEINRPLLSVKASLFCWFGALASAQIYLTVYLKSLGINAQTAAIATAMYPLSRLIGPSISGPIADRMGNYKPMLYISFSVQILMSICLLFIPHLQDQNNQSNPLSIHELMKSTNNITLGYPLNSSKSETECYVCVHGCPEIEQSNHKMHCLCQLQENQTTDQLCHSSNSSVFSLNDTCFINCAEPMNNSTIQRYVSIKFVSLLLTTYCIYQLFISITYAMMETVTLAMIKRHNGNYGVQRVWAIIGMSILCPVSGFLVDYVSAKKGYTDYSSAFYIFISLTIINITSVFSMDLKLIPPSQNILKDINSLCNVRVWLFLSSLFFNGIFSGFIESYLFWYLQDLGSPKYLMGLTLTFVGICSSPLSIFSRSLIDKFGCVSIITVAFFITSMCLIAYSYLNNPWFALLIEMPNSGFFQLMWISSATHSSQLVPDNLLASIQSAMVMSHYGLGRGVGTLIGGNLIYAYGEPISFRCMGVAAGIVAVIYSVLYNFNERPHGICHQRKYCCCGGEVYSLAKVDSP